MIPLTAQQIAEFVAGDLVGDPEILVTGDVHTDSREPLDGGLFVAKRGEETDGHRFVAAAASAGAVAAIVEHPVTGVTVTQIVVDDSVAALGRLANRVLAELRESGAMRTTVGITGSVGKTTTKHLLGHILSASAPTVMPERSYNNEVGMPLTVLRADRTTQYLVLEMGANHLGDLTRLTGIAHPDIGCVLCVGLAHAGEFGSIDNVCVAKTELVQALLPGDTAVLNRDDALVVGMQAATEADVLWFGEAQGSDVRLAGVRTTTAGSAFTLTFPGEAQEREVTLRLLGEHNAWNAAAAAACAWRAGIAPDRVVAALNSATAGERWRMQIMPRRDGVTIINDAYNANPSSMAAALRTLAGLGAQGHRTIAVLGGMAELGEISNAEHDRVGRQVVRLGIDQLLAVGPEATPLYLAANHEGSWGGESVHVPSVEAAYDWLSSFLRPGDVVLVKSSNSYGLRFLGDRLYEAGV